MNQTRAIHDALKQLIRNRGHTYADAAGILALSEASIKRLFSTAGFSLKRIERLCNWLEVEVADLVALSEDSRPVVTRLTPEQEARLLAEPRLLLVTFLVLNRWDVDEILETFRFSSTELTVHLGELERLGLVELFPFGRIRLRTARNFAWRADGPIQRYFAEQVLPEFLDTRFDQPGEMMRFVGGTLSPASMRQVHEQIEALCRSFDERVEADLDLPLEERFGVSLFAAFRPWEFSAFARQRRVPSNQSVPGVDGRDD